MKKTIITSLTAATIAFSSLTPINVINPRIVFAEEQQTKPNYESRKEIPTAYTWNLEHMYPTLKAWQTDVKKVKELSVKFKKNYQGKLAKSSSTMKKALDDYSELSQKFEKIYVYAMMNLDVNLSNSDLQNTADQAENLLVSIDENTAWFAPEIAEISNSIMKKYLKDKSLSTYKYFLEENVRTTSHTLSKELEELIAKISPLTSTGSDVYDMLGKDIKFPTIKDEQGNEVELTRANYVSYLESKDRNVRKQAYEAYYQTLAKFQDSFAQTLGAHVKANNINADVRKYKSAVEAALQPNNIPVKVYDQLIKSVNKGLPLMHRYMALKKKMLNVDELHMYDIYTPIVESDTSYIPYDQAKEMVLDGLKPMGKDYLNTIEEAFENRWVDVYSTDDKQTGAYQWGAYGSHPYLLLNYQGTSDDVSTIAHELGHAMHSYYSNKKQHYINSGYATFTAEVASTLNENLLWESQYKQATTKEQKMYLLNQKLESFRSTLFRQTQFAEFEKEIHTLEQNGESINAEVLKKIYGDINKKYYGSTIKADDEIAMEWARIPHFYRNFYVYQYATSFAASAALSNQVIEQGAPAVKRIQDQFLSAGGSTDPISILKAAGVDMSTSKPIDEAMEVFEDTLDELEKLLSKGN